MIQLDGVEYNVNTPDENAADMIATVNQYCADNNIVNTQGDVIQVESNWANPLYVMFRGFAYLVSRVQQLCYSAGCALSIASSSTRQLLNIADVAGVKRKGATKTTIVGTIYSNLSTADNPVVCNITTGLSMTVATTSGNVIFHPAFDTSIPVGSSRTVVLVAEIYGSFSIAANDNASFDENPEGFRLMVLKASSPGQNQETIAALRSRIQRRTDEGTTLDKAIGAITQLDGVSLCNIYYNKSVEDTETVMGIQVPPKQALVFVQGYADSIAETFYQNMLCECAGADYTDAILQTYTTRAGQELTVPIIPPENTKAYIRVYFNQVVDDMTKAAMQDTICTLAQTRTIGQKLTSVEVIDVLQANYNNYEVAGAQVSLDGSDYKYQVSPGQYQLLTFDVNDIQIYGSN